ncbi:MAG TPA: energy transducer TonB, partial [Geothrix sp.]
MRSMLTVLCCLYLFSTAAAQAVSATGGIQVEPSGGPVASVPVPFEFSRLAVRHRPQAPAYPPLARITNLQGTVLLRLTIGANGSVEQAQALEGPALLRWAAEDFLRSWTFQPVVIDGQSSRVQCDLQVPFRLTDVPSPGPGVPPSKVVIQLVQDSPEGAMALDPSQVQSEIRTWLDRSGLRQVEAAEADPRDTFHLKLEIQTLRAGADLYLCQTRERCSLWADRDLAGNEPGRPWRIGFFGHVIGRKGEGGSQELLRSTVRRTLNDLLVPPSRPSQPKTTPGVAAASAG